MSNERMMWAIRIHGPGSSDACQLERIPLPRPADDEVLLRVHAAGVNPVDAKVRARGPFLARTLPFIPGCDGAGVIEAIGERVRDFSIGEEVFYCHGGIGQAVGNYAEYACIPAHCLARKPRTLDMIQAAAAPLVCITAWEALFDRARLGQEQTVLIHGGTGGVGHVAIQLAQAAGCRVICTVGSETKAALARELGAEHCILYHEQDVVEATMSWTQGKGVDVLLDTVGGETLLPLQQTVARYGVLVSLLQFPQDMDWKRLRLYNVLLAQELMLTPMMFNDHQASAHQATILEQCAEMIDAGSLRIHIQQTFPLSKAAQAQARIEQGHTCGKIVLDCLRVMDKEDETGSAGLNASHA